MPPDALVALLLAIAITKWVENRNITNLLNAIYVDFLVAASM